MDSLDNHWRIKDSLEPAVHRMMLHRHGLEKVVVVVVNDSIRSDQWTTTRAEDNISICTNRIGIGIGIYIRRIPWTVLCALLTCCCAYSR